nr:MAG TPA: hypothetical protein [Caudoviricetes sp.]
MNPEKRIAESSWGIPAKVMGTITLDDAYYFKGSTNCVMTICTMDDGTINVVSQYGERMMTCTSVKDLAAFLSDLMSGKYA